MRHELKKRARFMTLESVENDGNSDAGNATQRALAAPVAPPATAFPDPRGTRERAIGCHRRRSVKVLENHRPPWWSKKGAARVGVSFFFYVSRCLKPDLRGPRDGVRVPKPRYLFLFPIFFWWPLLLLCLRLRDHAYEYFPAARSRPGALGPHAIELCVRRLPASGSPEPLSPSAVPA